MITIKETNHIVLKVDLNIDIVNITSYFKITRIAKIIYCFIQNFEVKNSIVEIIGIIFDN